MAKPSVRLGKLLKCKFKDMKMCEMIKHNIDMKQKKKLEKH